MQARDGGRPLGAGMSNFALMARALLRMHPYSVDGLLLAKRFMQVHVEMPLHAWRLCMREESKLGPERGGETERACEVVGGERS